MLILRKYPIFIGLGVFFYYYYLSEVQKEPYGETPSAFKEILNPIGGYRRKHILTPNLKKIISSILEIFYNS